MPDNVNDMVEEARSHLRQHRAVFENRIVIDASSNGDKIEVTFVSPDGLAGATKVYSGGNMLDEVKADIDAFRG